MTASVREEAEEEETPDVEVLLHLLDVVDKMDPGWAERELRFMPRFRSILGVAQKQTKARKHK